MKLRRPSRGFALLITITLLAFLVLLLVSLATLTRVETQVSGNNQKVAQARQNALLALNLALGQLQRHAGPDQRVTASADILTTYAGSPGPAADFSQFEHYWRNRNRHWTGVWGNGVSQIGYALKPSQLAGTGTAPVLLNWLVSGNEAATFTASAAGAVGAVSAPRFKPDLEVGGLDGSVDVTKSLAFPLSDPATGQPVAGVLLVGPGSASDGSAAGKTAGFEAGNFVVAPAVPIQVPAGTVPGLAGTAAVTIGRYAYWVGDEGAKARINLRDNYLQQVSLTGTALARARLFSLVAPQRFGLETMNISGTAPAGTGAGPLIAANFDPGNAGLGQLVSSSQLSFLATAPANQSALAQAGCNRFHDLTAHSFGVLADTYAGGLKKDLASAVAAGAPVPADTEPLFTPENTDDFAVPKWSHLRSYIQFTTPVAASGNNSDAAENGATYILPRVPTGTTVGFSPLLAYFSLGFGAYYDSGTDQIRLQLFPSAVLTDPYAVSFDMANYQVGLRIRTPLLVDLEIYDGGAWQKKATLDLNRASAYPAGEGPGGPENYFQFKLSNRHGQGNRFGPERAHIFLLYADEQPYVPVSTLMNTGDQEGEAVPGVQKYAYMATGVSLTPVEQAMPFRMVLSAGSPGIQKMDLVLAANNAVISGYVPPTAPASWYQAVQQVGFELPDAILQESAAGLPASNNRPAFAFRVQPVLSGVGSNAVATVGNPLPLRWIAQANLRAPLAVRTALEDAYAHPGNISYGGVMTTVAGTSDWIHYAMGINRAGFGDTNDISGPMLGTSLFDLRPANLPLLSIGMLQQANLSLIDAYPAFPLGNSLADFRIPAEQTYLAAAVEKPGAGSFTDNYYDVSWHLNRALWDRYFTTGIDPALTQAEIDGRQPLPNARLTYIARNNINPPLNELSPLTASQAYERAAAHLLVAGGFNINSTSEQAWRAFLTGGNQLSYSNGAVLNAAFPRLFRWETNSDNTGASPWWGTRELSLPLNTTPAELALARQRLPYLAAQLARAIVAEVRARGPFLSLADFINRGLVANSATGLKGALQAAIDRQDTAPGADVTQVSVNPGGGLIYRNPDRHARPAGSSYIEAHMNGNLNAAGAATHQARGAFNLKFLTQADLLSALGPAMAARSDTFKIRTYGEVVNPVTGEIDGRAWCEAVVQRLPDFIDPTDAAYRAVSTLNSTNQSLGRRIQIVSFRWLASSDI